MPKFLVLLIAGICLVTRSHSQVHVLPEVGLSYFTNEFDSRYANLNDLGALTLNFRMLVANSKRSGWTVETPITFRIVTRMDQLQNRRVVRRLGAHLPVLIQYSYGAGAHDRPIQDRLGFTFGGGWGWFAQQARSINYETPVYRERVSFGGPIVNIGFRYRMTKHKWFSFNDHPVFPVLGLRFLRQFDLQQQHRDVGAMGVYLGFQFGK